MSTLVDVAELAGVSVTTVSRMLNNRVKVSLETKDKIMKAMKELDYQPNEIARSLLKKNSKMIGLIVASANNYFFCKIIHYIEKTANVYGYKILLCISNHEQEKEIDFFRMLKANKVAGIILASHTQDLDKHINFDAPIITFERTLSDKIPSVSSDNYNGGVIATKHLIDKKCKKIAFFSDTNYENLFPVLRHKGYIDTLSKYNMEPTTFFAETESFINMDYENCIKKFFSFHKDVDGIFTSNDIIGVQIIRYCNKNNIKIPAQLKIIGYDGINISKFCYPSLTTIKQQVKEQCKFVVESIINKNEKNESIALNKIFPVSIVEREST